MIRELLHRWFGIHDWDTFEVPHLGAHRGRRPYQLRNCGICGDLHIKVYGFGGDTDWQEAFDPLSHPNAAAYEDFTRAYRQYMDADSISWDDLKQELGYEEDEP